MVLSLSYKDHFIYLDYDTGLFTAQRMRVKLPYDGYLMHVNELTGRQSLYTTRLLKHMKERIDNEGKKVN